MMNIAKLFKESGFRHRSVLTAALLIILTGCEQSMELKVESEVPVPLVTKLPLTMGIYYEDGFRHHVYVENTEDRPHWNIESGASQVELFNQILPSMFTATTEVNNIQASGVDAVVSPSVEEMQFAMPQETKSDLYEVWIKYNIRLYKPDGELIADWPVTGYGKSSTEFLKSRDDGLNAAINLALRDAGAKFALDFTKVAEVHQWLATKPAVCNSITDFC